MFSKVVNIVTHMVFSTVVTTAPHLGQPLQRSEPELIRNQPLNPNQKFQLPEHLILDIGIPTRSETSQPLTYHRYPVLPRF